MTRSTRLLRGADGALELALFRCAPDDVAWREPNAIAGSYVLAFPHHAVGIVKRGGAPLVADANRVVLYEPGSRYERHLIDPAGDRCTFIAVAPGLLASLEVPVVARDGRGFLVDDLAVTPQQLLRLRQLACATRSGLTDELTAEEVLLDLTAGVLGAPVTEPGGTRPSTRRAHARLVEDAREWIAAHVTEQWRLAELAAALHVAPAHLHRVFRARTTTSVHEHRDRLRLARALDAVLGGADDLALVGMEVGYSSHSHFTRRFRRVYGVAPSAVRELDEAVRMVTAAA